MKEFYDLWVNHSLRHCGVASAYWVLETTDKERREMVNDFCKDWVWQHGEGEWHPEKCFGDFDRYLEKTRAK